MIISAVVDPRVFGSEIVVDEFTKREVIRFLESVAESGVLIDDSGRYLLRESLEYTRKLETKFGQRIQLLLQEFFTNSKKYLVSSGTKIDDHLYRCAPESQISRIAVGMRVDAILTSRAHAPQFEGVNSTQVVYGVVHVEDWSVHRLESHRKQLLNSDLPLDKLCSEECEERVGRVLKYASSIKVLDAYLVASEQRARKFYEGISYFISVWKQWTYQPNAKLSVEIYTVGDRQNQNGFLTGRDAADRLKRHILDPLRRALPCVPSGFVKKDNVPPIFHARFIYVKMRAYSIDPGFDGFDLNGPIRRCFFRLEPAGERHVDDCLNLRSAV